MSVARTSSHAVLPETDISARRSIQALALLYDDLVAKRERRRSSWSTAPATTGSSEPQLPFEPSAARLVERIDNLAYWLAAGETKESTTSVLLWAVAEWVDEELEEYASGAAILLRDCMHCLDPRGTRFYLGPCDLVDGSCGGELFVAADNIPDSVDCPECGRSFIVGSRRLCLVRMMRDELLAFEDLWVLLRAWGLYAGTRESLALLLGRRKVVPSGRRGVLTDEGRLEMVPAWKVGRVYDALLAKHRPIS